MQRQEHGAAHRDTAAARAWRRLNAICPIRPCPRGTVSIARNSVRFKCDLVYHTQPPTTPRGKSDMRRRKMIIGYGRTSTFDQAAGLAAQERELKAAGAEKMFTEQVSSVAQRGRLAECLAFLREGDVMM